MSKTEQLCANICDMDGKLPRRYNNKYYIHLVIYGTMSALRDEVKGDVFVAAWVLHWWLNYVIAFK